jgi:hypothetical protein
MLKAHGTKRLKLNHDAPHSIFAFKFNLRRYTTAMRSYNETDLMNKLPRVQQMMRRLLDCEAINENLTANEVVLGATSAGLTTLKKNPEP